MEIARDQYHRTAAIQAVISHIRAIGPTVHLELRRGDTGDIIEAELSRERYPDLALMVGEPVSVKPRNLRLFPGAAPAEEIVPVR